MVTTDILDLKSWERFYSLLSVHGKVKGRLLIISNADVPEFCQRSFVNESSVRDLEFGKIEGFELDLETNTAATLNITELEDSAIANSTVSPPSIVILDLLKLSYGRLAHLANYFSQIAVPVVLYSGSVQSHIDLNLLQKVSCYCYISVNSTKNTSVFEVLKQYFQSKFTSTASPKLNSSFITRSFFEKVSWKWRGVVYGMQIKKRRKKFKSWKTRTIKRHNEFNKKKP